ncbi:single-strand DNA-binding protein [Dysgonomonas alginatilytica]|uniref:Single-stranded DNA-binding protein n=1 Tax=Dysgonomonas alginatilytica TaxID=1605892 RepID=A0A2V3PQJ4_9BACT|nr:single-stranded DNA-binding protein [Dysgonomonas alginatilytica]PXV63517.1 single-strand DNA-binding protein [Dysgonomonas alginatilytica]
MSVNKVILIGNVGKDPDIRYFDNGSAVVNFPLATTERGYTAANGTQIPDRTEWHNVVCWRGLAKVAEQFVKKGTQLFVEGKIRTRSYDDQNGIKRYVVEIYADNLELLGKKGDFQSEGNTSGGYGQQQSSSPASTTSQYQSPASSTSTASTDEADDLPF